MKGIVMRMLHLACVAAPMMAVGTHTAAEEPSAMEVAIRASMEVEFSSQSNPETWIARAGAEHADTGVETGLTVESREYNLYGFYITLPMADWISMDNAVFMGNGERWKIDSKVDASSPYLALQGPLNLASYLEGSLEDAENEELAADGKWGFKVGSSGPLSFYTGAGLLFSNRDAMRAEGFVGAEVTHKGMNFGIRGHYVEGVDGIEVLSNVKVSF